MVQMFNSEANERGAIGTQHLETFAEVVSRGVEMGYTFDEHTQFGYNNTSGYVWLWSEDEQYTLGANHHTGEEVEVIITCPDTGAEFFSTDPAEAVFEYFEHCEANKLEDPVDFYIDGICYEYAAK